MLRFFWVLLFANGVFFSSPATEFDLTEAIITEFKLSMYDLQDLFDERATATKEAYLKLSFEDKENLERKLGYTFKYTKEYLSKFSDIPDELSKDWWLLNRPGDYALPEELWNKFTNFSNALEVLREINNTKQEISNTLETSRNLTTLKTNWSTMQEVLSQKQNDYYEILQLLNNASEANEQFNVRTYWEMLSDVNDGYSLAEKLWREVEPLYNKLRAFVKKRLFTYYGCSEENFNETDVFPVYMTGSLLGDDWSNIADIILPRPYLLYDAKAFLHTKSSKEIFELADTLAADLKFPALPNKFWTSSIFNHTTCANLLLTFSSERYSEVLTCNRNSWKQYLEAHEITFRAVLRDYDAIPLGELRGRVLDEAVVGLGPFFAINAMDSMEIVKEINEEHQKEQTLLLLTALRVLPQLAFYYTADRWRLEALEIDGGGLGRSWESLRREIQGFKGVSEEAYDFLSDGYITTNTPYLSKFLGIFLQFNIIDYFKTYYNDGSESLYRTISSDATLYNVVKERFNYQWQDLITNNFGIQEITAEALLNYFKPLEEYLEDVPSEFITAPPFTTPPTTISTTTTTTTESLKRHISSTEFAADVTTTEIIIAAKHNETERENSKTEKEKHQPHNAGMYVGLAILACVAVVVILVLVRNRLVRRRKENRRRYNET